MVKSQRNFDRWQAFEQSTWSYQLFSQYDDQLGVMLTAQQNASKFTYKTLGRNGTKPQDSAESALGTGDRFLNSFNDITHWSNVYGDFANWTHLNAALACASNLETYMVGVIDLAIRSAPASLFGTKHALDGSVLLKYGAPTFDTKDYIISCTKGDWSKRLEALEKIFGPLPLELRHQHASLERLRKLRNNVGHAFGRNIENAQYHGLRELQPMERLSQKSLYSTMRACRKFAKVLDDFLLNEYVGDFEVIRFLSAHHNDVTGGTLGERVMALKKAIGATGQPRGKVYLKGLLTYWDSL